MRGGRLSPGHDEMRPDRYKLFGGDNDGVEDILIPRTPPPILWRNFIRGAKGTKHQQYRLAGTTKGSDGVDVIVYEFTGVTNGS